MAFKHILSDEGKIFEIDEGDLPIFYRKEFDYPPRAGWIEDVERKIIAAPLGGVVPMQLIDQLGNWKYVVIKYQNDLIKVLFEADIGRDENNKAYQNMVVDLKKSVFPERASKDKEYLAHLKEIIREVLPLVYEMIPTKFEVYHVEFQEGREFSRPLETF